MVKNKLLMLITFFCLLLIPLTLAYYSGDTIEIYQKNICEEVNINITNSSLPIITGEYSLSPCTLTDTNYWECNCTDDGITILMTTTSSTINTYEILINGWYYTTTSPNPSPSPPPSGGSGGGGSSGGGGCPTQEYLKISTNKCIKGCITSEPWYLRNGYSVGCQIDSPTTTDPQDTTQDDTSKDETEDQTTTNSNQPKPLTLLERLGGVALGIIAGLIIIFIYLKVNKKIKLNKPKSKSKHGGNNEKYKPQK